MNTEQSQSEIKSGIKVGLRGLISEVKTHAVLTAELSVQVPR